MYDSVPIETLTAIRDANLDVPENSFRMNIVMSACGTHGCMIGWYQTSLSTRERLRLRLDGWGVIESLGLSRFETAWLFQFNMNENSSRNEGPAEIVGDLLSDPYVYSKSECLLRLTKYIAYKKRKQAMWADYEAARRAEGNQGFLMAASEEASSDPLLLAV